MSCSPDHSVDIRENGAFWLGKDFSGVSLEDYQKLTYPGYAEVGMWMHPQENGELFYFFGPIVQNTEIIPDGMKAVDVPAAEYAVFKVPAGKDVKELHENINSVWKYIFNEWFDSSEYSFDESKVDFEYYHGEDTLIYVPIMKNSKQEFLSESAEKTGDNGNLALWLALMCAGAAGLTWDNRIRQKEKTQQIIKRATKARGTPPAFSLPEKA